MVPDTHRLARQRTIRLFWIGFFVLLGVVFAADFLIKHHAYFGLDGIPGFKAVFGFAAVVAMIVAARVLGGLLQRPDDYYDE
jgi:hypothetical protein